MKPHERFGLTNFEKILADCQNYAARSAENPTRDDLIAYAKWNRPVDKARLAMVHYLNDDHAATARYAGQVLDDSTEFFFGRWRSEVPTDSGALDPQWWRENELWVNPFREAVLWGGYLGDWSRVKQIAEYPGEDCPTGDDAQEQDKAYHLALATFLRDTSGELSSYLDRAVSGRKKRTRLAAQALADLARGDEAEFESSLHAVFKNHAKTFSLKDYTALVSQDGSMLFHIADRQGLQFDRETEWTDYIIMKIK